MDKYIYDDKNGLWYELQEIFRFAAERGKVGRNYIHIVPAAYRLFLFLNLHLVEVGNFALDSLDCFALVDTADMQIDDNSVPAANQ